MEQRIVRLRRWLAGHDPLGYVGARAIRRHLRARGHAAPSARTIARVLRRAGVTPQKRHRHPPPPGWYPPEVARGARELDQLDVVKGLHLRGTGPVEVLTGISLWGKLALAAPSDSGWRVKTITAVLAAHWRRWDAPAYLQADNATRFAGSTRAVRRLGRFIRFCLAAGVIPVFAPPRETGFQAAVESFNGLWQAKVWQRFRHRDLRQLRASHGRRPRRSFSCAAPTGAAAFRSSERRSPSHPTGRTASCAPTSISLSRPCASTRCAAARPAISRRSKPHASLCLGLSLFSLGGVRRVLSSGL